MKTYQYTSHDQRVVLEFDADGVSRASMLAQAVPAGAKILPADALPADQILAAVTQAVQQRLDDFARTRMYDGILSACTYATSTVPAFASEAQYAVEARDSTWAACYRIMAHVQAGSRPMPTVDQVLSELPPLEWPL